MTVRFSKVSATGNDFLVVNTVDGADWDWVAVARALCRRRHGVGADGLVVVRHLGRGRFDVRCINADGTPSPTDGNAMCACVRAIHSRYGYQDVRLLSAGREYAASVEDDRVAVVLEVDGPVRGPVMTLGATPLYAVRVGSEQAVAVLPGLADLAAVDVAAAGVEVRRAAVTGPAGANVGFAAVLGPDRLRLRCHERGPERESPSSGSGAVAAVAVLRATGRLGSDDVLVETAGGDPMRATVLGGSRVRIAGTAVEVFEGEARWDGRWGRS